MIKKLVLAWIMLAMSYCGIATAQETFSPPVNPEGYTSHQTKLSIQVDGILTEADWDSSSVVTGFIQKNPDQGSSASYPTEVRILYDSNHLYISAVCYQPEQEIVVQNHERDFNYFQNDLFGVAIDGFLDKRNSIVFQVTPLGNVRDAQIIDGRTTNDDWNATWKVKTNIQKEFWIAEIAIPWNILRYPENTNQLGVIFARNIRSLNEFSSAPAVPRSLSVYRMEYEGVLSELTTPPPSTNIQINPYALEDVQYVDDAGSTDTQFDPKIGGDIKWGISTNSVLDLTFNTDFAQAEADAQVVNFNRFSVYFPEKRQFFLENSDLFSPNVTNWIRPFFSRRIGLSNSGTPIPIDVGARYVNQSSDSQLGTLIIRQRETDNSPAANFGVLRYSKNLSAQSRIGSMVTLRNDQSLAGTPSNNNFTISVDGLYRPNPSFAMLGMVTSSFDDVTGDGIAAQFWTYYENNLVYIGLLEYYNRNYNPGMGLEILDDNFIMTSPAITFDFRPDWLPTFLRSYNPGMYGYFFHGSDTGDFLFGYAGIKPLYFEFENGASFYTTVEPNWQILDTPFYPVGIEVERGDYQYLRYYVDASTNPAQKVSFAVSTSFGNYYDGTLERFTLSGRIAPIPHIEIESSYQLNRIHNLGINATDNETSLFRFSPKLALNPRVFFSGLYQWNSSSDQHFWNARFSWEFMPLSYVYLVLNSNITDSSDPFQRVSQQQYIAKISYVHQF